MNKKLKLKIHGTHCASCEVLIERRLRKIHGVSAVHVNHVTGLAEIISSRDGLELRELADAIKGEGYSVSLWDDHSSAMDHNSLLDYVEIGAFALVIAIGIAVLGQMDILPKSLEITDNMSYGFVFLIGLAASISTCLAVTGGLLLTVVSKHNEAHPTLYFNAGRVVSYTLLGGLVGLLGSVIGFGLRGTGVLTIAASLVMIILGFQILDLFPWMKRFQPKMPKFIAHKIHDLAAMDGKVGSFTLGALTVFLPCGFTQALQLYVLAKGGFIAGALTMLVFSLGTLPVLLSLGAVSSFVKGTVRRYFLRVSAVAVIVLGFWNINNSFALLGLSGRDLSAPQAVPIIDGRQVAKMSVVGYEYRPSKFIVQQGVPVDWQIDASRAAGCAQVIAAPAIGVARYLPPSKISTITFVPNEAGMIPFSCAMGMTTKGASFIVVDSARSDEVVI